MSPPMEEDKRSDGAAVVMLVLIVSAVAWAVSYAFDMERAGASSAIVAIGVTYAVLTAGGAVYAWKTGQFKRWLLPAPGDPTPGFLTALLPLRLAFGLL